MATGLVCHELYWTNDSGQQGMLEKPHPYFEPLPTIDQPLPKLRLKNLLDRTGLTSKLIPVAPRLATREDLLRCHDAQYIDRIQRQSTEGGGEAGQGTPFGKGSFEIAALAAGGVLAAVDGVMSGQVRNAYALVHPPGHHARRNEGMGFCIFANGPLAAAYLRDVYGLKRIAIVDWDVHHGNGTQEIFWREPGVLSISLHQEDFYPPSSGKIEEIGEEDGKGYNLNIPLPAGSGEKVYIDTMDRIVLPALRKYEPDFVLVAAGFDAGVTDPLGRMMLNAGSFERLMKRVRDVCEEICAGRLVVAQEGGYDASAVPFHGLATLEALSGISAGIDNPFYYPAPPESAKLRHDEEAALKNAEGMFSEACMYWDAFNRVGSS